MNLKLTKCVLAASIMAAGFSLSAADRPSVLLIAVDDLNDWVGCLGGHPQSRTPNIDRLAERGVLFSNAHCQSPVCNPSRASLMSSRYPESSGIYFLNPDFAQSPIAEASTMMPQRFANEGYDVAAAGKLFHSHENKQYFPRYAGGFGNFGPLPEKKLSSFEGVRLWDWGAYPERDEQMPDYQIADWAVKQLKEASPEARFLGVGFYRPHVPQYVPQKWLDRFPADSVQLPKVKADDLDDLSPYAKNLTTLHHVSPTHEWVLENDQWVPLVQTYLASVHFVDEQVGKVLDALDSSTIAETTYIVLFSDHGFHLGEKEHYAKRTLWEDGTRVPMIIAGPGIPRGVTCAQPVELIDIYPTLLELTGLQADPGLEGDSLKPLLDNPAADWPHTARTSFGPENVAIRSEHFRYIRYADGSEELYDHRSDPHEWHNLIGDPTLAPVIDEHRKHLPTKFAPYLGAGSTGHKAFEAAAAAAR